MNEYHYLKILKRNPSPQGYYQQAVATDIHTHIYHILLASDNPDQINHFRDVNQSVKYRP